MTVSYLACLDIQTAPCLPLPLPLEEELPPVEHLQEVNFAGAELGEAVGQLLLPADPLQHLDLAVIEELLDELPLISDGVLASHIYMAFLASQ